MNVDFHGARKTDRQKAAVFATQKRAGTPAMKDKLLDAIVERYPTLRKWNKGAPKTITKAGLKKHVQLWEILISTDHHQDVAYVFYMFSCSWDPSGFQVLTHGDRVVGVGDADSDLLCYPHADPERTPPKAKPPSAAKIRAAVTKAKKRQKKNAKALPDELDDDLITITLAAWAGFHEGTDDDPSDGEVLVELGVTRPTRP